MPATVANHLTITNQAPTVTNLKNQPSKPSGTSNGTNMLVTRDGIVKLADFGAPTAANHLTDTNQPPPITSDHHMLLPTNHHKLQSVANPKPQGRRRCQRAVNP